ncbi:MAG: hypothetical protein K940chlam9_01163 [Chlamydiae bacterium]|nr:hypothetical protein [Chlamydiota bacterium]
MSELEDVPPSEERKIPKFLLWTYLVLPLAGIIGFFLYWNGSHGFLDRGYWQPLQRAAHTTYPFEKEEPYLLSESDPEPEELFPT